MSSSVAEIQEETADGLGLVAHLDEVPKALWAEGLEAAMRLTDRSDIARLRLLRKIGSEDSFL